MLLTSSKLNTLLIFKLPIAYISGVRSRYITEEQSKVSVRHRWINQNPFRSMYFAVQAMAAELSTAALVIYHIRKSKQNISMLIISNKADFSKKATGKIIFTCDDGNKIKEAIQKAIQTKEGQTCWMKSIGTNQNSEQVSEFDFQWTIKIKP